MLSRDDAEIRVELEKLAPISDAAKRLEAYLQRFLQMYGEADLIWKEIDPTSGQLDTLFLSYDRLKAYLKTLVSRF